MAQFSHIRLTQHKGLKSATLFELGKINVVCGPNNSGKTTVLECIGEQGRHFPGINTNWELSHRLAERVGADQRLPKHLYGGLAKVFAQVAESWKIVFYNDAERVRAEVTGGWKREYPQYDFSVTNFNNYFYEEFARPKVVLIPAKRRLEPVRGVQVDESIQPDGSGVLNFLFRAKNQDESTSERKSFEQVAVAFREISAGYDFDVFFPSVAAMPVSYMGSRLHNPIELRFRRKGSIWIHAADCGLGLQELLIILYFALASAYEVVLIEEPENHLHPEIQRRLIAFLRENTTKQFFLSTHSSVFLNTQFADRVFTCRMTDSVQVENATSRAAALTELGYSIADNLVSDLVVLCEGPKDKLVLDEFFQKMGLLERSNIKVWPLGGDIMDQVDLSVFQESHGLVALLDGDPGSSAVRKRFLKKCEENKIPVTRLERYALENYFSLPAIAAIMKDQMPSGVTQLNPSKRVSDQLGFEVKNNGGRIAKEMTLEDIKGTDFEAFLNQVESLVTQLPKVKV